MHSWPWPLLEAIGQEGSASLCGLLWDGSAAVVRATSGRWAEELFALRTGVVPVQQHLRLALARS